MIELGCNYSKPLLALMDAGEVSVDWIKLSRTDTLLAEVAECKGLRPMLVHTLPHAGMRPEVFQQTDWAALNDVIHDAGSPHVAIHLGCDAADLVDSVDETDRSPAMTRLVADRMTANVQVARSRLAVPLLVENIPYPNSHRGMQTCVDPAVITEVILTTDTSLLLDTSHVRVSAHSIGRDPYDFARALPLDRVREIHVAGPRWENGRLRDRHMELDEEDYTLLAWLLERTAPAMVTLEYSGTGPIFERPGMNDPEALKRQLHRLRGMLS